MSSEFSGEHVVFSERKCVVELFASSDRLLAVKKVY